MKILAPLYFDRFFNRLRWTLWSPAGRGMRRCAYMEWGQFRSNRGGQVLRYFVRSIRWGFWKGCLVHFDEVRH